MRTEAATNLSQRGRTLAKKGDLSEAIAEYQKGLGFKSNHAEAH